MDERENRSPSGAGRDRTAGSGGEPDAIRALEPRSPQWPEVLSQIDAPPERLWVRGREALLGPERVRVAVVGSRAPSPYGEAMAQRWAGELARAGCVVVSGLARGVDHAAHRGALEAGGDTVAVLGCGVDRPWPASELSRRLPSEGLLVSELRPGTPPRKHHFPLRNRLISGLSEGVLVIEAAQASGSLITARWAADQGRTVWAVPGRVDHPMSAGCHRLLREGATLVEDTREILAELGLTGTDRPAASGSSRPGPRRPHDRTNGRAAIETPSPLEGKLLSALRGECLDPDELSQRLGLELPETLAALVQLELGERVVRGPGGIYRLS